MVRRYFFFFSFIFLIYPVVQALAAELPPVHGFVEAAAGARVSRASLTKHDDYTMIEQRLQLKSTKYAEGDWFWSEWRGAWNFKGDFLIDEYFGGKTDFELREFYAGFSPVDKVDIKAGRQILTWGTGDFIFINDLFPKDYVSFYIGRDDEYLKKPSDAVRIFYYTDTVNVDFVTIVQFEPNTLAKGDRLSFFDSFQGGIAGRESERRLVEPARQADNFQYALRLYRYLGSMEAAFYYFRGFDPSSRSYLNEAMRELFYQRLDAYGASVRGPVFRGIGNIEMGYYYSPQDNEGNNRLIENSFFKALMGYERDMGNDLKLGFQYYYEQRLNYGAYTRVLLPQDFYWDEYRHVVTNRITKLFKNQTVQVTVFTYYSPSDRDGYNRSSISYDITDKWKLTFGVSIPFGEDEHTEFSQFKKNKNFFFRLRYSF